ncbi:hypothetical protein ES703_124431 [subsurface metagenome]
MGFSWTENINQGAAIDSADIQEIRDNVDIVDNEKCSADKVGVNNGEDTGANSDYKSSEDSGDHTGYDGTDRGTENSGYENGVQGVYCANQRFDENGVYS